MSAGGKMVGIILTGASLPDDENEFAARFVGKTAEQLIEIFNRERKKQGWVSARGRFLVALRSAFQETTVDCSAFISENGMSLSHPICLQGKTIVLISQHADSA
jgi:hypothetical protein